MAYKDKGKERQNKKEYHQKNKKRINERMRLYSEKWYRKNKKKIRLLHKKYYQENKEKSRRYHRKWYLENKKRLLQQSKDYYKKNKEEVSQRHKNYNYKNKKKLLRYKISWQKYRRKINPKYRLDENMGSAIARSLKGEKDGQPWEILAGYSLKELMVHLEEQFDNKMNWNNYGNYWVVDHVKPKSLFNYVSPNDSEFKQCWTLRNLQPLEKIKNIKKKNYYIIK